jgi:hypothetical protein
MVKPLFKASLLFMVVLELWNIVFVNVFVVSLRYVVSIAPQKHYRYKQMLRKWSGEKSGRTIECNGLQVEEGLGLNIEVKKYKKRKSGWC